MKKIYTILILIIVISCNSQNQNKTKVNMKKFDIERFNKNKDSFGEYMFKVDDRVTIKQEELNSSYWEFYTEKDSAFDKVYEYYKDGTLKTSFLSFPNDFAAGVLKEYDEQGRLIKEEDLDKPFTYTWEDVKGYLEEHEVEDIQKQVIGISRRHTSEQTIWILQFKGVYKDISGRFIVTLDGKTGEEIEVKLFKGKAVSKNGGSALSFETLYKKQ